MPDKIYQTLQQQLASDGADGVLDALSKHLSDQQRYHELFETLKMKVRHSIGLPLLYSDAGDELDANQRRQLEEGLIDACRQVGMQLIRQGKVREGWMYMRPVGDNQIVADELRSQQPNEENMDEFIEVLLHEGIDSTRGFQLVLDHYGTCNAITTFESAMHGRSKAERQAGAGALLNHLHRELTENVRHHVQQTSEKEASVQQPAEGASLGQLVTENEWLFEGGSYHIDTTHLASAVRFARCLSDQESLRQAIELTDYGSRLDQQLQYPDSPPFEELFAGHRLFFTALLGEDTAQVTAAVDFFRKKAEGCEPHEESTHSIEVYIDLLARLARHDQAVAESIRLLPVGMHTTGLAPSLLEMCEASGNYQQLREICQERNELLGFAIGLLEAKSQ